MKNDLTFDDLNSTNLNKIISHPNFISIETVYHPKPYLRVTFSGIRIGGKYTSPVKTQDGEDIFISDDKVQFDIPL